MSSKKGVGSSKNGRDSESKRLGLKIGAGQYVSAGSILVRQSSTLVTMLVSVEMILYLQRSMATLSLRDLTRRESRSAYTAKKLKLIDPLFQGVIFNILEK